LYFFINWGKGLMICEKLCEALFLSNSLKKRTFSTRSSSHSNADVFLYASSAIVGCVGVVYASVPLYRLFCQSTGFAGTPITGTRALDPTKLQPVHGAKPIQITFTSTASRTIPWSFIPLQRKIHVIPGQTALAFYSATNLTDEQVSGVATYNVIPSKAAQYFNKIQCFCFEEQTLGAGEQVDMPVFFFVDPEFAYDPVMDNVSEIVLSYTFFNSKGGPQSQY